MTVVRMQFIAVCHCVSVIREIPSTRWLSTGVVTGLQLVNIFRYVHDHQDPDKICSPATLQQAWRSIAGLAHFATPLAHGS